MARVVYTDGTTVELPEGRATLGDASAFQRRFGKSIADIDTDDIDQCLFIPWNQLRRVGAETRSFDDFLDALDTFAPDDDADPFEPAQTTPTD